MMNNHKNAAKVQNVIKSFGEVVAVSDASFVIQKGKINGFLGPNGAGKSTSIRMILGLIKPQSGSVQLFGKDPFTNANTKRLVGYIPERYSFPKWMKAIDYLTNFGRLNLPRTEAETRAVEILEEVALTEVAEKKISQFSKGMKQRMKIAQALIHKPALVIGDEPFNGLDPIRRKDMFDIIKKYRDEYNCTFFISSHILFEIEKIAERIILMYKGRTIAQGSAQKIREMIHDRPHEILITSNQIRKLAISLINHNTDSLISNIKFDKNFANEDQLIISTLNPRNFYTLLTDIIVDEDLEINELRATDEGLESLFQSLTIG